MTTFNKILVITSALFLSAVSQSALAYGPRDAMSYPHPSRGHAQATCEPGLQPLATNNPRHNAPQHYCPAAKEGRKTRLRLDHSGPRPRAVVTKKSRRGARLAQR